MKTFMFNEHEIKEGQIIKWVDSVNAGGTKPVIGVVKYGTWLCPVVSEESFKPEYREETGWYVEVVDYAEEDKWLYEGEEGYLKRRSLDDLLKYDIEKFEDLEFVN